MFIQLKQALILLHANVGSLPQRLWSSLAMVFSIVLVVCVLIGFLSMAKGFEKTLIGTGSKLVVIILGGGSKREIGSEIPLEEVMKIQAIGSRLGMKSDSRGGLMLSRELLVPVDASRVGNPNTVQTISMRGMDQMGILIRDSVRISSGRMFHPGTREIVVGTRIAHDFSGFEIGNKIRFGASLWTVVGHFDAGGTVFDTEIWANIESVQAEFGKHSLVQSLRLGLSNSQAVTSIQSYLDNNARIKMQVITEHEFYSYQSQRVTRLIRFFGWPLALLMAVGAIAGALNTMMSSVSDRIVEIATLRTVGFCQFSIFIAIWVEAIIFSFIGALIGVIVSWFIFHGWQATTTGINNTQLGFSLSVTFDLMLQASFLALVIGLIGGGLPAYRAAKIPLARALRNRG